MALRIIDNTYLSNIACAIRAKNGSSDPIATPDMATAITNLPTGGGGYEPTDEELTYSSMVIPFKEGSNAWVLKEYGDRIVITNSQMADSGAFTIYPYDIFNADITLTNGVYYLPLQAMFSTSSNLKEITGTIRSATNGVLKVMSTMSMFQNCNNLRTINDNFIDSENVSMYRLTNTQYCKHAYAFQGCYSLREIPKFYFEIMRYVNDDVISQPGINQANFGYNHMFAECYALNKIEGLHVYLGLNNGNNSITSNMFNNTFYDCYSLSKLTFATNIDGTPMTANWTNQIIDLTTSNSSDDGIGVASLPILTIYNSGYMDIDMLEIEGAPTTQYYVGDGLTRYWSLDKNLSKFGHTEAVELINSLPDTSAAGGNNTIKFASNVGQYTDYLKGRTNDNTFDSRISTLTDAEIAVAAAKGWTVSLV